MFNEIQKGMSHPSTQNNSNMQLTSSRNLVNMLQCQNFTTCLAVWNPEIWENNWIVPTPSHGYDHSGLYRNVCNRLALLEKGGEHCPLIKHLPCVLFMWYSWLGNAGSDSWISCLRSLFWQVAHLEFKTKPCRLPHPWSFFYTCRLNLWSSKLVTNSGDSLGTLLNLEIHYKPGH